ERTGQRHVFPEGRSLPAGVRRRAAHPRSADDEVLRRRRSGGCGQPMNRRAVLKIATVAIMIAVIAALYFSPLRDHFSRERLHTDMAVMRGVWYAPIAL